MDEVKGQILGTKPLPALEEVFAEVRREKSRRKVMLNQLDNTNLTHQNSSLATVKQRDIFSKGVGKEKQWRDHCNKPYHTKDTCWKIHGKPANWKPKNKRENTLSAYVAETAREIGSKTDLNLTEEQIQVLYRLINQGITPASPSTHQPTALTIQKGTSHFSLLPKDV